METARFVSVLHTPSRHLVARQLFFYSRAFCTRFLVARTVLDEPPSSLRALSSLSPRSAGCQFRAGEMRGMRYSSLYDAPRGRPGRRGENTGIRECAAS